MRVLKAGLGRSLAVLGNCQYRGDSFGGGETHVEGDGVGAEAVAAVLCDLVSDGTFLTYAIAAAGDEVVRFRLEVCLRARAALLAGFVRSILERQWEKERWEERRR